MPRPKTDPDDAAPLITFADLPRGTTKDLARRIDQRYHERTGRACIQCTSGVFAGRFFHLLDPAGETLGSDPEAATISMISPTEKVQSVHCEILPADDEPTVAARIRDVSTATGDASGASGVFVKVRAIKRAEIRDGQEIVLELIDPPILGGQLAFGVAGATRLDGSDEGGSVYGARSSVNGESISIQRGPPLKESVAFQSFLQVHEIEDDLQRLLMEHLDAFHDDLGLFDLYQHRLLTSPEYAQLVANQGLEAQTKLKLAERELAHFLPWETKSRPLKLVAKRTGDLIGEVRWGGAYVVPCSTVICGNEDVEISTLPKSVDDGVAQRRARNGNGPAEFFAATVSDALPINATDVASFQNPPPPFPPEGIQRDSDDVASPSSTSPKCSAPVPPRLPPHDEAEVVVRQSQNGPPSMWLPRDEISLYKAPGRKPTASPFSFPKYSADVSDGAQRPASSSVTARSREPPLSSLPRLNRTRSSLAAMGREERRDSDLFPCRARSSSSASRIREQDHEIALSAPAAATRVGLHGSTQPLEMLPACASPGPAHQAWSPSLLSTSYHLFSDGEKNGTAPEAAEDGVKCVDGQSAVMKKAEVASIWWMDCYLSSRELEVLVELHPQKMPAYAIPDFDLHSLWAAEPYFKNVGLGLPPRISLLPRAVTLGRIGKSVRGLMRPKDEASIVNEPWEVRFQRCKKWLERTPRQCVAESAMPRERATIRLPPCFGSGFHLSIIFENGVYKIFETYPVESEDFSFTQAASRQLSFQTLSMRGIPDDRHPLLPGSPQVNIPQVDIVDGVWLKLIPGEEVHDLAFGDTFKIGTVTFKVQRFNTGFGGLQGYRASMEDEEVAFQDLQLSDRAPLTFLAVYDGHGGRDCAAFLREELHLAFIHQIEILAGHLDATDTLDKIMYEALYRAFIMVDRAFLRLQLNRLRAGGTRNGPGGAAVVVALMGRSLWCANTGDARCVLCRGGKAVPLSVDHKPDRPDELDRIQRAGGYVKNKRVLGRLAVSRAFGDIEYKNVGTNVPALVIADPEIRRIDLEDDDEFLLLACDGLFDVYSSQDIVDTVRLMMLDMPPEQIDAQVIVESIVQEAIEVRASRDNVSAILVLFRHSIS